MLSMIWLVHPFLAVYKSTFPLPLDFETTLVTVDGSTFKLLATYLYVGQGLHIGTPFSRSCHLNQLNYGKDLEIKYLATVLSTLIIPAKSQSEQLV